MKFFLFILLLSELLFSKILIVNSYSKQDQCGKPQLYGFLDTLYLKGYKRGDFDIYFLNVRVTPKEQIKTKVEQILSTLDRYDTVITFDDAAFKLVGIPASKKGKQIFFSGLNYPFKRYKKENKLKDNISGVKEKIFVKEVLTIFNKIRPINKVAFFYGDGVGKILKLQTEMELKDTKFLNKINFIHINNISELTKESKKVGKDPKYTLFMPFAMSIYDKYGNKSSFIEHKNIFLKNIKKPDFSINIIFTKLGFLGFGGADFYKGGKQLANIFLTYQKTHEQKIENIKNYLFFVNIKRAQEIKFKMPKWFIKNYLKDFVW